MNRTVTRLAAALADRYRIERELGQGGMATVYLAEDLKHHRQVAIKVLRPDLAMALGADRFLREIQTTANLRHPHILPLFDSGQALIPPLHAVERGAGSEVFLYYVMPYVEGESLRDRLNRDKQLPLDEALRITVEVAGALSYAHERGVVHRDIKPENIMLERGSAVVADFGIARAVSSSGGENLTQTGMAVGTPAYMSTEQSSGDVVDHRSDMYSLASVLYEMLAGEPPYTGPTAQALIVKRMIDPVPSVRRVRESVSPQVDSTIMRALAKAPADRFARMEEFAAALVQPGEPARPQAAKSIDGIVILPFVNSSPDPENEYFSDGLTEELISDLARVKALRVISRTSTMQLKGTGKSIREIGRELAVRYALEGSVRRAGNSLRITAQLVEAETDTPLWADKYSGTMDDVFDVQERVSRSIVSALQVQLTAAEDVHLAARPIQNPRAFEVYLRARDELRRWGVSTARAESLIQQAIEIEGETPALRALKAFMLYTQVRAGVCTVDAPLDRIESEARELIRLVPEAPYGHALMGYVGYERGELKDAVRHLRRSLELDPTDPDALFSLGISLQAADQIEAAGELAERLKLADPLSPFSWILIGVMEWFSGRLGGRIDALEKAVSIDPASPIMHWGLGYTCALVGRVADAAAEAEWMRAHLPTMPYTIQLSSLVDALEGRPAAALDALRQLDITPLDAHHTFHICESFAMAGDIPRALELLERAVDRGFYPYQFISRYCPFLAPLRGVPEFTRIAAKAERRVKEFSA